MTTKAYRERERLARKSPSGRTGGASPCEKRLRHVYKIAHALNIDPDILDYALLSVRPPCQSREGS